MTLFRHESLPEAPRALPHQEQRRRRARIDRSRSSRLDRRARRRGPRRAKLGRVDAHGLAERLLGPSENPAASRSTAWALADAHDPGLDLVRSPSTSVQENHAPISDSKGTPRTRSRAARRSARRSSPLASSILLPDPCLYPSVRCLTPGCITAITPAAGTRR